MPSARHQDGGQFRLQAPSLAHPFQGQDPLQSQAEGVLRQTPTALALHPPCQSTWHPATEHVKQRRYGKRNQAHRRGCRRGPSFAGSSVGAPRSSCRRTPRRHRRYAGRWIDHERTPVSQGGSESESARVWWMVQVVEGGLRQQRCVRLECLRGRGQAVGSLQAALDPRGLHDDLDVSWCPWVAA